MSKRWIAVLAVAMALSLSAPAIAQVPAAVQEAVLSYLTIIASDYNTISPAAVKARLDTGEKLFLLDVREANEFEAGHIANAVSISIRTVQQNLDKLPAKDAMVVVICASGIRAAYVTMALRILGWKSAMDMSGGMNAWNAANLPTTK